MADVIVYETVTAVEIVEVGETTVEVISQGVPGPPGPGGIEPAFSRSGVITPLVGSHRYYLSDSYQIIDVRASVGTPPTGDPVIVDVNLNGVSIYAAPGDRPTIAIGAHTSGVVTTHATNSVVSGDYLTVDIDQVGSLVAGANLTVSILCHKVVP